LVLVRRLVIYSGHAEILGGAVWADCGIIIRPETEHTLRRLTLRDQRTASTYIFGAVCPKEDKGAALIMPACNTEAMNLHLAEIAATVAPAAHAILLVDQAGWHLSTRLLVPANITIGMGRLRHNNPPRDRTHIAPPDPPAPRQLTSQEERADIARG
jgi:hypothetical protein